MARIPRHGRLCRPGDFYLTHAEPPDFGIVMIDRSTKNSRNIRARDLGGGVRKIKIKSVWNVSGVWSGVRLPTKEKMCRELWKFFSIAFWWKSFFSFFMRIFRFFSFLFFHSRFFMVGQEKREMHHVHIIGPIATLL